MNAKTIKRKLKYLLAQPSKSITIHFIPSTIHEDLRSFIQTIVTILLTPYQNFFTKLKPIEA